jgi:lycopene beta-cyclase
MRFSRDLELKPYTQPNQSWFYSQAFDLISKKNIHFLNEKVTDINELKTHVYVATETQSFTGDKVIQ